MSAPVLGLMGQKRSGKDALASFLVERHGFVRLAFADRLKNVAFKINPLVRPGGYLRLVDVVEAVGWDAAKSRPEVRRFLQELGVAVRDVLGADSWVRPVMDAAEGCAYRDVPVVVTDVRFPNEAIAIRGIPIGHVGIVRVDRPGLADDDSHVSEHAWRSVEPDALIENDGGLDDLAHKADKLAAVYLRGLHS